MNADELLREPLRKAECANMINGVDVFSEAVSRTSNSVDTKEPPLQRRFFCAWRLCAWPVTVNGKAARSPPRRNPCPGSSSPPGGSWGQKKTAPTEAEAACC